MPASKNTWSKGLNSDLSKLKSQQDSYLNAKNIRVLTDEGTSSLAIENIKGNKLSFKLPQVQKTFKIDFTGVEGNVTVFIDRIDTIDGFVIQNAAGKSNQIIADELNVLIQASTLLYDNQYVKAYYNNNYIVIYDFLPQSEVDAGISGINVQTTPSASVIRTRAVYNHTILGWGYYNDNLVIISCDANSNSETPVGTEGFIWDVRYINQDNTISNPDGDYLNPLYHLKYAGKLDLSRQYAIYKHLKCRYESSEIIRLVWTDWNNNLRTCNIAEPQIWATPETVFSFLPVHAPQKPVVSRVILGGNLPVGKYQYFYQLYTEQGAVSTYSPLSNLIGLNAGDLSYAQNGGLQGQPAGKSTEITIINLDTNYSFIRLGYVIYQTADNPEAFWFFEDIVPQSGTYTTTHNGNENDIPIEPFSVITNLNKPPSIFKTIDVVRNRLFAANAKTIKFDMDGVFDTRAYRYTRVSKLAKLYNEQSDVFGFPSVLINGATNTVSIENVTQTGTFYEQLLAIPDSFDLINPFNNEDPTNDFNNNNWITNSQFKYQKDGLTIGGSGPNISYDFCIAGNIAETGNFQPTGSPYLGPRLDYNGIYASEFNDTYTYAAGASQWLDTPKSPLIETLFTGYSRGEVYRWGIVFFDKYGFPSYANWIGDIKFPFSTDDNGNYGLTKETTGVNGSPFFLINDPTKVKRTYDVGPDPFNIFNISSNTDIILNGNFLWNYNAVNSNNTSSQFCDELNAAGIGLTATAVFPSVSNSPIMISGAPSGSTLSLYRHINQVGNSGSDLYLLSPTNPVETQQLGITFYLDTTTPQFQAIKDSISGWSYVRVKRDVVNSTKLGTGYLQPTFQLFNNSNAEDGLALIPYEKGLQSSYIRTGTSQLNSRWNYLASRVRAQNQVFIAPNFLTRSVGGFSQKDYIRFIGRTKVLPNAVKYWQEILSPDFNNYDPGNGGGVGSFMYYVKSNDFDYNYLDSGTTNPPSSIATTSNYLNVNSTWEVKARLWVNKSTTGNYLEPTLGPLFTKFYNMSDGGLDFNMYTPIDNLKFTQWGTQCEIVQFDSARSYPDTANVYGDLVQFPFYLASYERFLAKQYGGASRSARYGNQYILTNHFMPYPSIPDAVIRNDVYGGDTYVNYFDWQRSNPNGSDVSGWPVETGPNGVDANYRPTGVAVFFPAECIFNADLNTSTAGHASVRPDTNPMDISNYTYNPAMSQQNTTNIFVSKGFNQTSVGEEPHTIYGSDPKIDNERSDAWRTLFINNSLSVNGNYGEINRIAQFKDRLFYYQNDAIGIAAVDERVLEGDGTPGQTQLGIGKLLQRYDYITTETGCKHSFAVETTGDGIYHYDSFINKLFKYTLGKTKADSDGMNPLTDIKGLVGFFRTAFVGSTLKSEDKILRKDSRVGIVSGYNSEYNTVYFTFFDEEEGIQHTISYNELMDAFESFYDFYPSMYLNMRKRFLSLDPNNTGSGYMHNLGLRNNFYDQWFPSTVKFRVNENSDFVKTFDNFQINTEVIINNLQAARTVTSYSISNDYQIIPEIDANFVQKIRSWRMIIPRDETNPALTIKPRISDKYMDVTFNYYDSNGGLGDDIFRLHDVITEYSMRSKITPK